MEFSRLDRTNKEHWDETDHYACFVYWVKKLNKESNEGVFFGTNMADAEMDQIVWALKEHLRTIHTPSRINRGQGGNAIFGTTRASAVERGRRLWVVRERVSQLTLYSKYGNGKEVAFQNDEDR